MTSGWRISSIRVQAAVPEVVWWPANIIEMNMPVTSSGRNRSVPSGFLTDMSTSTRSCSSAGAGGPAARPSMIPWMSVTSSARAASRRWKLSMSA